MNIFFIITRLNDSLSRLEITLQGQQYTRKGAHHNALAETLKPRKKNVMSFQ